MMRFPPPSRGRSDALQGYFPGGRPILPGLVLQARAANLTAGDATALPANFSLPAQRGQELPPALREHIERTFGANLSSVRIHVGPQALAIGALAFTVGDTIVFAPGQYAPDTPRGRQLLGHSWLTCCSSGPAGCTTRCPAWRSCRTPRWNARPNAWG